MTQSPSKVIYYFKSPFQGHNREFTSDFVYFSLLAPCKFTLTLKCLFHRFEGERAKKSPTPWRFDPFKLFEKKHGDKFALLNWSGTDFKAEIANSPPGQVPSFNGQTEEELLRWKKKMVTLKSDNVKRLKLFQKLTDYRKTDVEQIPDLYQKPFLMGLLNLIDNGKLAAQKKEELETSCFNKVKFDFEKKNLQRRVLKYMKVLFQEKALIEYWTRVFITLIAFYSILTQIYGRFFILRERRELNKKKVLATLHAINSLRNAAISKGDKKDERCLTEAKMGLLLNVGAKKEIVFRNTRQALGQFVKLWCQSAELLSRLEIFQANKNNIRLKLEGMRNKPSYFVNTCKIMRQELSEFFDNNIKEVIVHLYEENPNKFKDKKPPQESKLM